MMATMDLNELLDTARTGYEIQAHMTGDVRHVLEHVGVYEPTGTWTGGACPRHGHPIGSDVALADLSAVYQEAGNLVDFTWYPCEEIAQLWAMILESRGDDLELVASVWSHIWAANCEAVTLGVEAGARKRGTDGLLVMSFEHNRSRHAIKRPHVHNLVPGNIR